jgi:DHA1 family bicyclomycin/chloramphenicol resistance-like MFS transporter
VGPVIGGYLQVSFGWKSCFIFLSIASVLVGFGVFLLLPESNSHVSPNGLKLATIRRNYTTLLRDQEYVAALLCGGMLTAGNFAWTAGAPFLFRDVYHFSPDQYGNIALPIGAGYVAGTFMSGRLSKRITAPILVYGGMGAAFASGAVLLLIGGTLHSYPIVVALVTTFTAGMGVVMPMSAACALSRHPEIAGSAAGLLGSLQILTGTLGTLAIRFVRSPAVSPIALILTITSLLSTLAAYVALKPFRDRVVPSRVRLA